MMPYTSRFIHRSIELEPSTAFVQRSMDRPNIYMSVQLITHSVKTHRQFYWVVPKDGIHPLLIAITIVFTQSSTDGKLVCNEF